MSDRRILLLGMGAWMVAMFVFGLPHVLGKHFHVDEFQVGYNVAQWGLFDQGSEMTSYAAPYMVPLSWLVSGLETTAAILLVLRLCFFGLYCACLVGIAFVQPYFTSARGRLLVLAGATLFHPLWLNGFDIRHDSILVAASIALFGIAQYVVGHERPRGWVFLLAGGVAGFAQTSAFKAFLYWVPFCGLIVLLAMLAVRKRASGSIFRPALLTFAGFLVSVGIAVLLLVAAGRLDDYKAIVLAGIGGSQTAYHFSFHHAFNIVALSSPIVFAGAAIFLVVGARQLVLDRSNLQLRSIVSAAFLLVNLLVLVLNPTPFSYNFVHIFPFAFICALDLISRVEFANVQSSRIAVAGLVAACLLLFVYHWKTDHYLNETNELQLSYIAAAEALTSEEDTVLDGVGLVFTRKPVDADWMLHSLSMPAYRAGERTQFHELIVNKPSPVAIASYRWSWLLKEDLEAIRRYYVQLHPKLFVLGTRLPSEAGSFTIHYAGRYFVKTEAQRPLTIDSRSVPPSQIVELRVGPHEYRGAVPGQSVIHWIGPRLEKPPAVADSQPQQELFVRERLKNVQRD